jgi:putative membrane protein
MMISSPTEGKMLRRPILQLLVLTAALSLVAPALAGEGKSTEHKLSSVDAKFVRDAAMGGLMEVQLGKLAKEKAFSEKVKEFGSRMEQDHSKANSELMKIVSEKGVNIPSEVDAAHKSKIDKVSKLSGDEFDRQYVQGMISDHRSDIKKFQNQSQRGKDPALRAFATKTLPTLKEHLKLAETTAQEIKTSEKSAKRSKTSNG